MGGLNKNLKFLANKDRRVVEQVVSEAKNPSVEGRQILAWLLLQMRLLMHCLEKRKVRYYASLIPRRSMTT